MKKLIISLIVLTAFGCNLSDKKKSKMEPQTKIIEMVLWKSKKGISVTKTRNHKT